MDKSYGMPSHPWVVLVGIPAPYGQVQWDLHFHHGTPHIHQGMPSHLWVVPVGIPAPYGQVQWDPHPHHGIPSHQWIVLVGILPLMDKSNGIPTSIMGLPTSIMGYPVICG